VDHPAIRNETLRVRRTGDRAGCRNTALIAGVSSQTTAKQAAPKTMPAVEAARISSVESSRLCTSADERPMWAKNWPNSTTRLASAMSPKATGLSSREMVAVYARLASMSPADPT
jgi:hypothetical protein